MANANSNRSGSNVSAVLYLRMSSNKQEKSIPQQRDELRKLAKAKGYSVVGEFKDEGVSGDKTELRTGFLAMRDAAGSGKFDLILCEDQDRLGRYDLMDAGYWLKPFRDAGVSLETIAQGPSDWDSLIGQFVFHANQIGKNQFLKDLSRRVCRGQLAAARSGKGTGGNRIPYGYRVQREFDERGKLVDYRLVVDPAKAQIVRRIFAEYDRPGGSLRGIATGLNADRVPPPSARAKTWNQNSVAYQLKNRKYLGTFVWGMQGTGRYFSGATGEITARRKSDGPIKGTPIVHEHKHEAIIDQATFDRVQGRLIAQQRDTHRRTARRFVLSGLCVCGDCGGSMNGTKSTSKTGCLRYQCRRYGYAGKSACYCNSVPEQPIVDAILREIEQRYLSDEALRRLRKAIAAEQGRSKQDPDVERREALVRRIKELDQVIDNGAERILSAPAELAETLSRKLAEVHADRERFKSELEALASSETPVHRLDAKEIDRAIESLRDLRKTVQRADREQLAAFLRSFVTKIELRFDHKQSGKLMRSKFASGTVFVRPESLPSLLSKKGRHCARD